MERGRRTLESLGMNPPFWKHKKVLLTGHTGFKGSWLSLWLQGLGADVSGYSIDVPTDPSLYDAAEVGDGMTSVTGDVCDLASLKSFVHETGPEIVIHMAAQSLVRRSYTDPVGTYDTNIMGTVNLLEAVRNIGGVRAVIIVTSDKCYDNEEREQGYREDEPMGGYDPYSSSKGCAELITAAYRNSFFNNADFGRHETAVASVRAGNVIGGGDWTPDALVVDVFRALTQGAPVQLRYPSACRPWQHVLQALSGYLTIAARLLESDDPSLCGGWNIGPLPGNEISVREVVERFLAEWGEGSWVDAGDPSLPREANILRLSIDKALWQLGWRPRWTIDDVLRHTAHWYRQHHEGRGSMRQLCLEQAAAYETAPPLATRGSSS